MSRLSDIVASKQQEVASLRERPRQPRARKPFDVRNALKDEAQLSLIAEVKLRSPSAGSLSRALAPAERALAYAEAGAAMISVLCDAPFFDGSWEHLAAARAQMDAAGASVPLLAKEFVIDPRQVAEARERGADAVLLIARIVDAERLGLLAQVARDEGIEPLIEVVDERELEVALEAGARIVGVNARDLDTLAMDKERAARVLAAIPSGVVAVHLSGLRTAEDVAAIARGKSGRRARRGGPDARRRSTATAAGHGGGRAQKNALTSSTTAATLHAASST